MYVLSIWMCFGEMCVGSVYVVSGLGRFEQGSEVGG